MGVGGAATVVSSLLSMYRWRMRPLELITRLFQEECLTLRFPAMMQSEFVFRSAFRSVVRRGVLGLL